MLAEIADAQQGLGHFRWPRQIRSRWNIARVPSHWIDPLVHVRLAALLCVGGLRPCVDVETPRAVVLLSLSVVHMNLTLLRILVGAARVAVGYVLLQMLDWQLVVDTSADTYWGSMSCSCALFLCAKISECLICG